MIKLGPRQIHFRDGDDIDHPILIWVELDDEFHKDGDEDFALIQKEGVVHIQSSAFERQIRMRYADDLSLIYWLLKTSDIYVQWVCREMGYELFATLPGDIEKPFDTYAKWGGPESEEDGDDLDEDL